MTQYEYKVESLGTSGWSFLEGIAGYLQSTLDGPHIEEMARHGWELWQVNTFNSDNARGFILIFRRPKV